MKSAPAPCIRHEYRSVYCAGAEFIFARACAVTTNKKIKINRFNKFCKHKITCSAEHPI